MLEYGCTMKLGYNKLEYNKQKHVVITINNFSPKWSFSTKYLPGYIKPWFYRADRYSRVKLPQVTKYNFACNMNW